MAKQKKKKVHECDWTGCRKRKGVAYISIVIRGADNVLRDLALGWLCPYHYGKIWNRVHFWDIRE